jgi:hypothetical protein
MKGFVLAAMLLMACGELNAQPMPSPGTQRTDLLFNEADVVCICKLLATEVENVESKPPNRILQHIRGTLEVAEAFKPATLQPNEKLSIRFSRLSPGSISGDPRFLESSETAILFLKKTPDGTYEFSDYWFGINRFQVLPKCSGGAGLITLESTLLSIVEQTRPGGPNHDDLRALYLLEGFPKLSSAGMSRMAHFANSPDANIALAAIGTLMKSRSRQSVELLKTYLDNYKGDKEPMSVWSIGAWLPQISDPDALPALQALTGSRFTSVQVGAMDALRKIKSPSSAAVLVQRLDDSNSTVRYQAVITLAETFGKDREFAPSMKLFNDDPEKYVRLWKTWWSEQHGVAPLPKKRPEAITHKSPNP